MSARCIAAVESHFDEWHPDNWTLPSDYRIYLSKIDLLQFALIDAEDASWACLSLWSLCGGNNGLYYAARKAPRPYRTNIFLHLEVLKRVEPMPAFYFVGDHKDGNTMNCRRDNLHWVTQLDNSRNRHEKKKR